MPFFRLLHTIYKMFVSPFLGERCRYYPYCSDYAIEALEKQGCLRGGVLALYRLIRCNPWGGAGYDPVPDRRVERRD